MTTVSARSEEFVSPDFVGAPMPIAGVGIVERLAGVAALALSAPAVIAAGIAVRILSGKPPLVAHRRVGLNGEELWMWKLRTMWGTENAAPARTTGFVERLAEPRVPPSKLDRDERVTSRFAAFLRKYSIDELPQFLHVAAGRMSIVGPRPLTRVELDTYYGRASREVLRVPPGITGLWQILGRNRLTYPQRRRLDLFYVRNRCSRLYAMILLRTPGRWLTGRDAS